MNPAHSLYAAHGTRHAELSDDLGDRVDRFDADELLIQASKEIRQRVRIKPKLLEHGGVQASDVKRAVDGLEGIMS